MITIYNVLLALISIRTNTNTRQLVRNLDDGARTVVGRLVHSKLYWNWCKREMFECLPSYFFSSSLLVWQNKYQGLNKPL